MSWQIEQLETCINEERSAHEANIDAYKLELEEKTREFDIERKRLLKQIES